MTGIWDDLFTGVRYVKLQEFHSAIRWNEPILHLENRASMLSSAEEAKEMNRLKYTTVIKDFVDLTMMDSHYDGSIRFGMGYNKEPGLRAQALGNRNKRLDIYNIQKYNFDKYALFLSRNLNKKMVIVRKERHFVDFSKIPKYDAEAPGLIFSKYD